MKMMKNIRFPLIKLNKESEQDTDVIGYIVILLYAALYIFTTCFHEPWFDEAQAWEIGKTASYWDMLTIITHTEGHPPLWSLILSIPSKLGVPYLWGIKTVAFVFSITAVYLIVFKSPFPRTIRCLLPFSYFVFYQYGVISRTYCVMMVAMFMSAIYFKTKEEKPFTFVFWLWIVSLCSAFGLLIAAGICFAWCIDIVKNNSKKLKTLIKDRRVHALFSLLILALIIVWQLTPYNNTFATNERYFWDNIFAKVMYAGFAMLGDSYISSSGIPDYTRMGIGDFAIGTIATIAIWIIICHSKNKEIIKYYFLSYIIQIPLYCYYSGDHHTGVMFIHAIWGLWIAFSTGLETKGMEIERISFEISPLQGKRCLIAILEFLATISIVYSILSVRAEVIYPYCSSKDIASYIKEKHLEDSDIMVNWYVIPYYAEILEKLSDIEKYDSNHTNFATAVLAYFDKNFIFNHNFGRDDMTYANHFKASYEENINNYEKWAAHGIPDVLLGSDATLSLVYGDNVALTDFKLTRDFVGYNMWKGNLNPERMSLWVSKKYIEEHPDTDYLGK